jgi:hypothetical protein
MQVIMVIHEITNRHSTQFLLAHKRVLIISQSIPLLTHQKKSTVLKLW